MKALTGMTILEFESLVITLSLVFQKYQATRRRLKRFGAVVHIYRNHNSLWADKFILIVES